MNDRPIGVFDSGVGGLTVFRAVERAVPGESLIYVGDTARVPYGTKSPKTVERYALQAARFLREQRIKLLVVACNTASSVALDPLAQAADAPVMGVIEPGARQAAALSKSGRIGVIGTRATVDSGAYPAAIRAMRPEVEVISRACPLFVPLAEEGWEGDDVVPLVARRYLAPLQEARIDTLVLGCTHYPLLRGTIGQVMGQSVRLVDSAESTAAEVRQRLERDPQLISGQAEGDRRFFVTDDPEPFQQVAQRFLGRTIRTEACILGSRGGGT